MTRDEQAIWDIMAEEAIDYIKSKGEGRNANRLRQAYLDQMSENRWRNRDFEALINAAFDSARNIEDLYARDGDRYEDFIAPAMKDIIDGHFADSVLGERRLADDLDDDTYRDMKKAVEKYNDILGRRRGRDRDDRRDRRDRDDDRRDRRGGRDRDYDRRSSRDRDSYDRRSGSDLGRSRSGDRDYRRESSRDDRGTATVDAWQLVAAIAGNTEEEREERRETRETRREEPVREVVREETPSNHTLHSAAIEGPDFTKARPFDDFWEDGEHWKVFHKCDWKLTGKPNDPITQAPSLYNVKTHIKYFVKDKNGHVREEHINVTDENRYLMHEMLNDRDVGAERIRGSASVSVQAIAEEEEEALPYVEEDEPMLTQMLGKLDTTKMQLGTPAYWDSKQAAIFASRAKMFEQGSQYQVSFGIERTPIVTSSLEQLGLIDNIFNCASLTEAAQKMRELKPRFDVAVFEALDARFSNLVLRALRHQFQYEHITSLSFSNDWDLVLQHLAKKRDEEFSAQFARRTAYITSLACCNVTKEELPGALEDLYEVPEGGKPVPAVAFLDFFATVNLAASLDQLGIGQQLRNIPNGACVTNTHSSEMCQYLRELHKHLTSISGVGQRVRIYLTTSDNRLVEVIPYAARTDNFILALV